MLISCASIQGISWLEASGAIAAENTVLRVIADEAGLPDRQAAASCPVAPPAISLHLLSPARRRKVDSVTGGRAEAAGGRRQRRALLDRQHAPLLEMSALVVNTPDHRLTAEAVNAALDANPDVSDVAAVVCTSGTTNAGIIDDLAGVVR